MKSLIKNNGFTLVELLVVIFILAIVGTVAFGIITGTLRGANKTGSINNIRQNGNYVIGQMTKMISYLEFEGVSTDGTNFDKTCITPITNGVEVKMQTFDDTGSCSTGSPKARASSCERLHNYRGRDHTHDIDDFADPDFPGARKAAKTAGLPYFRAGKVELGGTQLPLDEASSYQEVLRLLAPQKPFGADFKKLMRSSLLRDRLCGIELIGEDLPYATNRVDLDPEVRDWRGIPVARITYGPGPSEIAAQAFYMPWLVKLLKAAGADVAIAIPELPPPGSPSLRIRCLRLST